MEKYICFDIGGTSIKYGLIQRDGQFLETSEIPTEAQKYGGAGIVEKLKKIISEYMKSEKVEGICVSTAGMVDFEAGRISYASPLIPDYTGTEMKQTLEELFSIPCEIENDVNCAGLAEVFAGAGKDCGIVLCLTVGTGIGGAIILNRRVFHGSSGSGCEVGYMHLPGGEFQDLAAGSILVKKISRQKGIPEESIDGRYVFEKAKSGDKDCIRAIREMCDILGMGIANICYVVNPEVVVLGGGIMAQKEYLGELLRKSLDKYLIPPVAAKTRLVFAENQNKAGMLGAFYHFMTKREEIEL